ncbi:hypothetical protein [Paenibacillus sp. P32E]|uniref:hypothetical protein n=1 Tax=Paenibacillus sp. P32E TaxID=1349434 RepID=UPI00093F9370|nr:hypothetical protein [Paenibacillus sp. P32E]OKP93397.1 hypothetical protein A3848_05340 [Paenibacillus sp. P32E]
MVDGLPKYKQEIMDLSLKDNNAFNAQYGFNDSTLLMRAGKVWDDASARDFQAQQPEQFAAAKLLEKYNFDSYSLGMDNLEPDGSTPEGVINGKVKDLWNKTIPKLILSETDVEFDNTYNDFIGQMDKVGAEKAEKVMYQRHLEDMKKKGVQ